MTETTARNSIAVFGTTFQNPILLAAGTAGFGRELIDVTAIDRMGGIVTKAVSPEPRAGNVAPRVTEFDGGMLNAIGLANPGVEHVVSDQLPWLDANVARVRVIVNVVGNTMADYVAVVERLTEFGVVTAFEINVSCPNIDEGGKEFGANDETLTTLVAKVRAATAKPIVVKLAPNLSDLGRTAQAVEDAGADGFTLVNTMPSEEQGGSARAAGARLGFGRGGVSGPLLFPIGVAATKVVRRLTSLPIIGAGGVRAYADLKQYLDAGASLVAVGTAALVDPRVPERLVTAWEADG
ncbi:MAG: dihydroorotate dehydrogenase [Gemmatimonadales bacterium]